MDQKKLQMFSFLVFTKLEGAVTTGMIHLGDKLGLYSVMRSRRRATALGRARRRAGLHERWVREWAYNQAAARIIDCDDGRAVLPLGGGRRGPCHARTTLRMASGCSTGSRTRWTPCGRCPRASAPGSGTTTTAMVPKLLSALNGRSSLGTERTCSPSCSPRSRGHRTTRSRDDRGRRGLRRRWGVAPDGGCVPEQPVPRLRHQPLRARGAPRRSAWRPTCPTSRSMTPASSRCPTTDRSVSSPRSTASTT